MKNYGAHTHLRNLEKNWNESGYIPNVRFVCEVRISQFKICSLFATTGKMAIKKIECLLCNISYKSRFCLSLHQHVHQQLSKILTGYQCNSCKKTFVKLAGFERHLQYHCYSNFVKSSVKVNKNTDGKSNVTFHLACLASVRMPEYKFVFKLFSAIARTRAGGWGVKLYVWLVTCRIFKFLETSNNSSSKFRFPNYHVLV